MKTVIPIIILLATSLQLRSQVIADFSMPDTICVNKPVIITNLTTGGTTFYWSFCSGNTGSDPVGSEMKNTSGFLSGPAYITVAQDGEKCYSFVSNHFNFSFTRFYHGTSFRNDPLSGHNILLPGVKTDSSQGIQIKKDQGKWYGFLVADNLLLRLDFGDSLSYEPTLVFHTIASATSMHGLAIVQEDNLHWYGITSSSVGNKVYRISFGDKLTNVPVFTDITGAFVFKHPGPLSLVQEYGQYYCFVVNSTNSTLSRASFGGSLNNDPVWTNLGKVCISNAMGIMLIRECEQTNGFMSRYVLSGLNDLLFRLVMPQGISGPVSTVSMGNMGNLNRPQQFSEITRVRDTVYTFLCNQTSTTITRLSFITCSNSSIPSSNLYDPPPYSYDSAGTYNVRLTVNEGMPDQQNICKHIVVVDKPPIPLGPDRTLCNGENAKLWAGPKCDTIRWSTGDTTEWLTITKPGKYWVYVSKFGCSASDTVTVGLYPLITTKLRPDTTICEGRTYTLNPGRNFISWKWSTGDSTPTIIVNSAGKYWVHTLDTNNCPGADTVNIIMKPAIDLYLVPDTMVCVNSTIVLHAVVTNPAGAAYQWQDGSGDSLLTVSLPGVYWVRVSRNGCAVLDSSLVKDCAGSVYFPNAFSPNGDGINDFFHPIGQGLTDFNLTIFNRWGQQVFTTTNQETGWDGSCKVNVCPADVYSWIASYQLSNFHGTTYKIHGTVMLVR